MRLLLLVVVLASATLRAAEVIPPVPPHYFNDDAGVVSRDAAARLDDKLRQFEKDTSNQIIVAIYPRMQSDSSIEDYTIRVAQKWGIGQKDRKNGIVLFVFTRDRRMFMQVGYGLEGAVPDAMAGQIIENEIKPRFRSGDYEGGLTAGIDAIMSATRGEYQGRPQTNTKSIPTPLIILIVIVIIIVLIAASRSSGPVTYTRRGRFGRWGPPIFIPGGWGRSSGGFGGGGGGGFSAGGGSFGGGGAGGSW